MILTDMGVAHGRRHAAIGDDAAEHDHLDGTFAQHPLQPRHVKRRIGGLLDREMGRLQFVDELLPPASRREITFAQKRFEFLEVRRIIGSPSRPGTRVNWVDMTIPPA